MLIFEQLSFDYPWAAALASIATAGIFIVAARAPTTGRAVCAVLSRARHYRSTVPRRVQKRGRLAVLLLWWLLLVAAACGPHWIGDEIALPPAVAISCSRWIYRAA